MARDFGPFPTKPMYEVVNRRMQRALALASQSTGFVASGQGAVTAGTGAQLAIAAYPDGALVDGLYVENPASETVTLTTNTGSTNPRIDRLVMRLDMTAQTIAPFQIVGTPAASPQAPPFVQTATVYDMPLVQYRFPGSGSAQNPGSIVDERVTSSAPQLIAANDNVSGAPAGSGAGYILSASLSVPAHRPGILRCRAVGNWVSPTNAAAFSKLQFPSGTDVPGSSSRAHNNGVANAPAPINCDGYIATDGTARSLSFYISADPGGGGVTPAALSIQVWLV